MKILGFPSPLVLSLGALALLAVLAMVPSDAQAFFAPVDPGSGAYLSPGTYPSNSSTFDQLRFLNASSSTQQKKGTLIVGTQTSEYPSGTSNLCLNTTLSDLTEYGDADPTTCIHAWSDVLGATATNALPLGSVATAGGTVLTDYSASYGFVHLSNDLSKSQQFGLIVEANSRTSLSAPARAIYAADAPAGWPSVATNWAAQISGSAAITDGTWSSSKSFCLNGISQAAPGNGPGCILRWTDPFFTYNGVGYVALSPAAAQTGTLGVVGSTQVSSVQAGSAAGAMLSNTCGNGICNKDSNPVETAALCPIDCETLGANSLFTADPGPSEAYLKMQTWNSPSQQYVLVLRKAGSVPSTVPVDGVVYSAGDQVGDATVAYASLAASQLSIGPIADTKLTNGTTYYYAAYDGNDFPRYGAAVTASTTPGPANIPLTLTYSGGAHGVAFLTAANTTDQSTNCINSCTKYFTAGTKLTLTMDTVQNGYFFTGFSGSVCPAGSQTCSFTITSTINVTASFRMGGGKGLPS